MLTPLPELYGRLSSSIHRNYSYGPIEICSAEYSVPEFAALLAVFKYQETKLPNPLKYRITEKMEYKFDKDDGVQGNGDEVQGNGSDVRGRGDDVQDNGDMPDETQRWEDTT